MPSTPLWLSRLRDHPDLTSTGFRLLPAETIEPALGKRGKRAGPVRIGTSDPLPANMRGIGLIFYRDNPDALYARFADQNDDDGITADVYGRRAACPPGTAAGRGRCLRHGV